MSFPRLLPLLLVLSILTVPSLTACGGDDDGSPADAGAGDGAMPECQVPELAWSQATVGATPGVTRQVFIGYVRDYCHDATISLESADEGVATVAASADIPSGESRAQVAITAVAVGTTTVRASWTVGDIDRSAEIEITVSDDTVPTCEGSASGNLAPGGSVETDSGIGISLPDGASRDDQYHVDPLDVTVGCADDQLPDGFEALGPAVTFGPEHVRFHREVPMAIPVRLALLPEGARAGHVEVSYTGPGVDEPRIVPVAFDELGGDWNDGMLHFAAPRLGTYQAVVRTTAGAKRDREFTFRGITGVSMGGFGTGLIGYRHMDRFDFVAPLGAAWDWAYLLDYIRKYHLGGFCTETEREADPTGCAEGSSLDRVPEQRFIHEHIQDFEHWWYEDDKRGQGGTFDREEYIRLFRDLSYMFGNPNSDRSDDPSEPNITPPGVPDSERTRDVAERCSDPIVIPPYDGSASTGFFDDEYNPEGTYPVITFCDGAEVRVDGDRDIGIWDPDGANDVPIEVALAVDIDGNGKRDPGEPVIRDARENFEDCGLDRTCDTDEAGYDPVTNPDPAGDDYDYQYNPGGTEGNFLRDGDPCDEAGGEAFDDSGLDGVMGTAQLSEGGYDTGEANGCWDLSRGAQRMLDRGPKQMVLDAPEEDLRDTDVFADGGIRDLFNFAVASNHAVGAFAARGMSLRYYNGHSALHLEGRPNDPESFVFTDIDWTDVGRRVMVRYGNPDASPGRLEAGDGQHVGTGDQAVNRLLSAMAWMSALWPDGDRRRVSDRICTSGTVGCDQPNQILVNFTSPTTGREGPASIILPPGYFQEEYADYSYPVVYFLHGYGMSPEDLIAIGVIIWNFMITPTIPEAQRLQKMIFVFPDGRCRGDECVKGTFYTDAPEGSPGAAQMETYMLDLMDYVDENYRTRDSEVFEVVE